MNIPTIIAIMILIAIVFFAVRYIVRAKRSGAKCIGCPVEGSCQIKELEQKYGKSGSCCH